jgi:UrcA family protein
MLIKSIFVAALMVATPIAAVAHEPLPETARVSAKGLDLNTDAGAMEMLRRIDKGVATVCGEQPSMVELVRTRLWRACAMQAQGQALASLHSPKVSAMAAGDRRRTLIASR